MEKKKITEEDFLKGRKLAVYKRVSTEDQDLEKRQNQVINNYLNKHGMNLSDLKSFPETGSAYSKKQRPEFQKLLQMAKREEIDGIIVSDGDRLSRQTKEHFELRKLFDELGLPVIIASKGELYKKSETHELIKHLIEDGLSKLESDNNSTRTRDTLENLRSKGHFTGGAIPYGYTSIKKKPEEKPEDDKAKKAKKDLNKVIGINPDPDKLKVVKEIFDSYQGGGTFSKIANKLKKDRPSEEWTYKKVRYIISNPFYTGHLVYHRKSGSHSFNPIEEWNWMPCDWFKDTPPISKEQWLACWKKYQDSKNDNPYYLHTSYSFQGILSCSCGKLMRGVDQRTKSKTKPGERDGYRYYKCPCGQKVNADKLHELFRSFYRTLPLPLENVVTELFQRFTKEYETKSIRISEWESKLEMEEEFLHKLLKMNRVAKAEHVYLKESEEVKDLAFLITKKRAEESINKLKININGERRFLAELYEMLKHSERLSSLFQTSLNTIEEEDPLFLRTLVLCMVKECSYQENKVLLTFHLMPPQTFHCKNE
ncbi:recombinase family protein [Bacillus sp. EB93]|nr:recombinase family protein [Peribacillus frigoritolerans]